MFHTCSRLQIYPQSLSCPHHHHCCILPPSKGPRCPGRMREGEGGEGGPTITVRCSIPAVDTRSILSPSVSSLLSLVLPSPQGPWFLGGEEREGGGAIVIL